MRAILLAVLILAAPLPLATASAEESYDLASTSCEGALPSAACRATARVTLATTCAGDGCDVKTRGDARGEGHPAGLAHVTLDIGGTWVDASQADLQHGARRVVCAGTRYGAPVACAGSVRLRVPLADGACASLLVSVTYANRGDVLWLGVAPDPEQARAERALLLCRDGAGATLADPDGFALPAPRLQSTMRMEPGQYAALRLNLTPGNDAALSVSFLQCPRADGGSESESSYALFHLRNGAVQNAWLTESPFGELAEPHPVGLAIDGLHVEPTLATAPLGDVYCFGTSVEVRRGASAGNDTLVFVPLGTAGDLRLTADWTSGFSHDILVGEATALRKEDFDRGVAARASPSAVANGVAVNFGLAHDLHSEGDFLGFWSGDSHKEGEGISLDACQKNGARCDPDRFGGDVLLTSRGPTDWRFRSDLGATAYEDPYYIAVGLELPLGEYLK